jgi:cytidylate kinase
MTIDLLHYMSKRVHQQEKPEKTREPGPVITISREFGCPAKKVAKKLAAAINKSPREGVKPQEWNWISKEILHEAAEELNVHPNKIKYVFEYEEKSVIDDILASLSDKYYKSDKKIRQTIRNVIYSIADEGNVIIVGRGGIAITKAIPHSFHVNLEAPLEWRAIRVSTKQNIGIDEARKLAIDIDKKREKFREGFEGKNTDYTHFDVSFNCMTSTVDEIVKALLCMIKTRGFI